MIKAIYRKRRNGNYDFVAAFSSIASKEARQSFLGKVLDGEEVIVKDFKDLEHLTDVIEGWEAKFEKNETILAKN